MQVDNFYAIVEAAALAPAGDLINENEFVKYTLGDFLSNGCVANSAAPTLRHDALRTACSVHHALRLLP